tara:strand:- start:138 stop:530 length:393 start_codon:yes stop_codon:yes gene_type:complete
MENFVNLFMSNLIGGNQVGQAGNYTGGYASGGKFSIHDIFKGGRITGTTPMEVPYTDEYGRTQYRVENVPQRGIFSEGKARSPVPLNPAINFYKPTGAGVGRYTPMQPVNRNAQFLENLLKYNKNMKGLL